MFVDEDARSDEEILGLIRDGNRDAYRILWNRHLQKALAVARSCSTRVDPEDVVSEAFTRTLEMIDRGRGPKSGFRPYLLAVVRNTARSWGKAAAQATQLDDSATDANGFGVIEFESAFDGRAAIAAYSTLPPRWKEVLWYTEIEGLNAFETGVVMGGLKATAVSALAYRAREGLRRAWRCA